MITDATGIALGENNSYLANKIMVRARAKIEKPLKAQINTLMDEIAALREQLDSLSNSSVKQLRGPSVAA